MIHRYYAPVQLLALLPILYLTVQKGTPTSAGPLKVRGPIWSNRLKTGPGLMIMFGVHCTGIASWFLHFHTEKRVWFRTVFPKLFLNIAPLNNLLAIKRPLDKKTKANLFSISDNHNLERRLILVRRISLVQFRQLLNFRFDFSQKQF